MIMIIIIIIIIIIILITMNMSSFVPFLAVVVVVMTNWLNRLASYGRMHDATAKENRPSLFSYLSEMHGGFGGSELIEKKTVTPVRYLKVVIK